jgi:hypothetical protein
VKLKRAESTRREPNILDAMTDPNLFAPWFSGPSWAAWRAFLAALFALPAADGQMQIFTERTGRQDWPTEPAREAWLPVGRRAGKSLVAAFIAVFVACFRNHAAHLAPGEVATVMVISADRKQSRTVLRYVQGFLEGIPLLAAMVKSVTSESVELVNRTVIEVHTCSFRTTRGYSLAAVVADEVSFWRSEDSASPDVEVIGGLRPGLATIPGSLLLCISSPYSRRGALWEAYRKHFGRDGDPVLVWQSPTKTMNPLVPQDVIDQAYQDDEAAAAAEWGGEFRRDVETFLPADLVASLVVPGRQSLPAARRSHDYVAFSDPSGGSGADSMTLCIAHQEARRGEERLVLDVLLERRAPFSPDQVTAEFAALVREYRVDVVQGDRYAGQWPAERFEKHGVVYQACELTKSEIYQATLPLFTAGKVELLDSKRLVSQLTQLERKTTRAGRDSIDHGPGAHDDLANAACGALWLVKEAAGLRPRAIDLMTGRDLFTGKRVF